DGLNTVVPYNNDIYYKSRPVIGIKKEDVLRLDSDLGFNGVLEGLKEIYDQGWLSVLNNIGYPNPDRSHFRSMDIWQTASGANSYLTTGWLGRYLDTAYESRKKAYEAIEVSGELSPALFGETVNGLLVPDLENFFGPVNELKGFNKPGFNSGNTNLDYLYKTLADLNSTAQYLYQKSKIYQSKAPYPTWGLALDLKLIAELIISGAESSVYYATLDGFDTHVDQTSQHHNKLNELGNALNVFVHDLKDNNRLDEVVIMVFSEFGRRVAQNAANGTDHGTANNLFIISSKLKKPGIFNSVPDLTNLDQGDLKYTIDFRSVYASLLHNWLGADDERILGGEFDRTAFI
ncbi:MAG TPA: DUF1501 domain-containing protein, partial [Chitinophagales bacterium]|nr:DUF1501 domain-containing protein [Chitinophagales bacterium]